MDTDTPAALPPAVREVLADAEPFLREARGGEDLLAALLPVLASASAEEGGGEGAGVAFALADGLYWAAVWNWAGQGDPLYSLAFALGFRPSPCASGPEEGLAEEVARLAEDFLR